MHGDHEVWKELRKRRLLEHDKEDEVALDLGFGVDFGGNGSRAMEKGLVMLTLANSQGVFFAKRTRQEFTPMQ